MSKVDILNSQGVTISFVQKIDHVSLYRNMNKTTGSSVNLKKKQC